MKSLIISLLDKVDYEIKLDKKFNLKLINIEIPLNQLSSYVFKKLFCFTIFYCRNQQNKNKHNSK